MEFSPLHGYQGEQGTMAAPLRPDRTRYVLREWHCRRTGATLLPK